MSGEQERRRPKPDDTCSSCSVKHSESPLGWIAFGWECESCFRYWYPEIASPVLTE